MTLKNILHRPVSAGCTVALILLAVVMYPQSSPQGPPAPRAVTDRELLEPDPADWLMWRRTLNSWGYSPLNQINTRQRRAGFRWCGPGAWGRAFRKARRWCTTASCICPTQRLHPGHGRGHRRSQMGIQARNCPRTSASSSRCPASTAIWPSTATQIIDTSADDFMFALDEATGKLEWETRIVDYRETPAQETAGPIIANGKIFSTRGCEYKFSPDGCIITAHDAETGKELWRTRTIPRPGEPGDESWGGIPDQSAAMWARGWSRAMTPS